MITIKLILITCTLVLGLKVALSDEMLLERAGKWFAAKVDSGHKVYDLFICPWCMGTLQSIVAHGFALGLGVLPLEWSWTLLIRWPLVVMASSFISGTTWTAYETLNAIKERNRIEFSIKYSSVEEDSEDE